MFPRTFRFIVLFLFACLTLQQAALADKIMDFSDMGGMLSGSNASLALPESGLNAIAAFSAIPVVGNLGAIFLSGGDSNRTIRDVDGALFLGAFSGPITWTLTTLANGTHNYILTAVVTASVGSTVVQGLTAKLTANAGKGYSNSSASASGGGKTAISYVPEPSTVTLLSTGLLAIIGGIRRRPIG